MNSVHRQMVKVNAASLESFAPDYSLFQSAVLDYATVITIYRVLQK